MGLKISSGTVPRAQKIVLYGVEGIGKTTLASKAPDVLFIDTEGGTAFMDVKRIDGITTWSALLNAINEVAANPDLCRTLAIDTADWAEQAMIQHVLKVRSLKSIEDAGYGKGYTYLAEEFVNLLKACDNVISAGVNVIITAHAKMRKQELPDEMGAFDRWELKLSKQCAPLLKEWADAVLFCNYKTIVVTGENNVKKGTGGRRVIYTCHKPAFDAKNRHGLPDEMDMTYENIAPIFERTASLNRPVSAETLNALADKMEADGVTAAEVEALLVEKGKIEPGVHLNDCSELFCGGWLKQNWGRVVKTILSKPEKMPF